MKRLPTLPSLRRLRCKTMPAAQAPVSAPAPTYAAAQGAPAAPMKSMPTSVAPAAPMKSYPAAQAPLAPAKVAPMASAPIAAAQAPISCAEQDAADGLRPVPELAFQGDPGAQLCTDSDEDPDGSHDFARPQAAAPGRSCSGGRRSGGSGSRTSDRGSSSRSSGSGHRCQEDLICWFPRSIARHVPRSVQRPGSFFALVGRSSPTPERYSINDSLRPLPLSANPPTSRCHCRKRLLV